VVLLRVNIVYPSRHLCQRAFFKPIRGTHEAQNISGIIVSRVGGKREIVFYYLFYFTNKIERYYNEMYVSKIKISSYSIYVRIN